MVVVYAYDKAAVLADRAETVQAIADEHQAIQDDRQEQLNELSEEREEILREEDELQILVNQAVDAAQRLAELMLAGKRQVIELQYLARDAEYRSLKQVYEKVRDDKRKEFESFQKEALRRFAEAMAAVQQADVKAEIERDHQRTESGEYFANYRKEWFEAWKKDYAEWLNEKLDRLQTTFEWAGFVPVVGAFPDLLNAVISLARGNFAAAAINSIAAIPWAGDGVKGAKMIAKAASKGDELANLGLMIGKNADKADEIIEAGAKASDSPLLKLMDEAAETAKNGGCFLPGQTVSDLEIPVGDFHAGLASAGTNDTDRDELEAWIFVMIAAGFVVAALQLEKRRLVKNPVCQVTPPLALLDELFSSESPWESQRDDNRSGKLVVT